MAVYEALRRLYASLIPIWVFHFSFLHDNVIAIRYIQFPYSFCQIILFPDINPKSNPHPSCQPHLPFFYLQHFKFKRSTIAYTFDRYHLELQNLIRTGFFQREICLRPFWLGACARLPSYSLRYGCRPVASLVLRPKDKNFCVLSLPLGKFTSQEFTLEKESICFSQANLP